jgi:RNA recognition motif-containing protein
MYENSALSQAVLPAPFPDPEDDMPEDVERPPQFEVHVKNIAFEASEDDLRDFFKECGTITKVKLLKGKAFIGFEGKEG